MLIRILLILLVLAHPAIARETVQLTTHNAPAELIETLRSASLVIRIAEQPSKRPEDILAAAQADYRRLLEILYAEGRYNGVVNIGIDGVEAATLSPLDLADIIQDVEIILDAGSVFQFGEINVSPLPASAELPEEFASGKTAKSGVIAQVAKDGIEAWRMKGHAAAAIKDQRVTANHRKRELDVELTLDPGRALRFGTFTITSDTRVSHSRIQEIAGLPENALFSPALLTDAIRRLRRTETFSSVTLTEAENSETDDRIDIEAHVTDALPRRFGFGGEYSTTEGISVSGYWLHRNLMDGAERLRTDVTISGIGGETNGTDMVFTARYTRPANPDPDTNLFFQSSLERLNERDFRALQFDAIVGLERIFSENLRATTAIDWQQSRVEDRGNQNFYSLSLVNSAEFDRRNDKFGADAGEYIQAELRPFFGYGKAQSGVRLFMDGRLYRQPFQQFTTAGRLQWGSVNGVSGERTPPGFLFYSGGSVTVRGHDYQSLGIDLGNNRRRGGRSFLGTSLEGRISNASPVSYVIFADAGYIGENALPDGTGDWHSGAGVGIRYDTGIGPIRADLAFPVNGVGHGAKFYIGVGQAF
ncbi:MAG: BamA/TamA family outer membrane protein [Aestuariivita sp.]|nr:BamA/TamA family outer membrane protein [Aestuariivita sp.]